MNSRYIKALWSPPLILSMVVLVLWFSWNAILGFVLHTLIILAEILELTFDVLLEDILRLEGHSAQMYTAWTGLIAFVALIVLGYRAVKRRCVARYRSWNTFFFNSRAWARNHWPTLAMPLLTLLVLGVLF